MNREQLTKKYNKMVASIEKQGIYDGRGTYDLYVCKKCGAIMITTYGEKGVTPFVIKCNSCVSGFMQHMETYKKVDESKRVVKWVRPSLEQFLKLPSFLQDHVLHGGLMLETELQHIK